jgi:hypothetical protein
MEITGSEITGECIMCGEEAEWNYYRNYKGYYKGFLWFCPHHAALTAKYPTSIPATIINKQNNT